MKYKAQQVENWYGLVNDDGERTSFHRYKNPGFYAEMKEWESKGNTIEPFETPEEIEAREQKELERLEQSFKSERDQRLKEADKWELPSILSLFDITIESVIEYKQILRDLPLTHTTREDFENPNWPEKLIDKDLA